MQRFVYEFTYLWLTAVTSCDHSTTADGRRRIDAASLPRSRLSVPHCYSSRLSIHCSSRRLSVSFLLVAHSRLPSPFHLVAHSRVCVASCWAPKPDGNSPQMNPGSFLRVHDPLQRSQAGLESSLLITLSQFESVCLSPWELAASCMHPRPLPSIFPKSAFFVANSLTTSARPVLQAKCNGVLVICRSVGNW